MAGAVRGEKGGLPATAVHSAIAGQAYSGYPPQNLLQNPL